MIIGKPHSATASVVVETARKVNRRAANELLRGMHSVHTDDVQDIDHRLELTEVDAHHIELEATTDMQPLEPAGNYHVILKAPIVGGS